MAKSARWPGASGVTYSYTVFEWPKTFNTDKPGNFIFSRLVGGQWQAIYVGETDDLSKNYSEHHALSCIEAQGVTHIHAHFSERGQDERLFEKRDLIETYEPPCNQIPKRLGS